MTSQENVKENRATKRRRPTTMCRISWQAYNNVMALAQELPQCTMSEAAEILINEAIEARKLEKAKLNQKEGDNDGSGNKDGFGESDGGVGSQRQGNGDEHNDSIGILEKYGVENGVGE